MPPKVIFESDTIIEAAFDLVENEGFDKLTVRAIAARLKCSVAPIYSNFKSIKDIELILVEKSTKLLLKYQSTGTTGNPFLNMGVGYVLFAIEHKYLYRKLFNSNDIFNENTRRLSTEHIQVLLNKMEKFESLKGLSGEQRKVILDRLWVYVHGYASLINIKAIKNISIDELKDHIHEVAVGIIEHEINKQRS